MATITIKIESDELAREVLTQLGYLPSDDDVPDLISVDGDEEVRPTPKTHVEAIHERMACSDELLPKVPFIPSLHTMATRKMPETPKQNTFCTTEDPNPDVEPVDNELGASLDVFSEETVKERDELYKQCLEIRKSTPCAEDRLKATAAQLMGDAMCDHNDKKMREAAKSMVRKEFAGHTLEMWPALQKVLDGDV
jgi:hypothetical protein